MTLVGGAIVPHPPLLIPQIGQAQMEKVESTRHALVELASQLEMLRPDTLVFVSPHSPIFKGAFGIRMGAKLKGSFRNFGFHELKETLVSDREFVDELVKLAPEYRIALAPIEDEGDRMELDWGVLVPYSYIGAGRSVVALSISPSVATAHFRLGQTIARAAGNTDKNIVLVASGDLSHRLSASSPHGYSERGCEFDAEVAKIVEEERLDDLLSIDERLAEEAGECGLRSFVVLAGAFKDQPVSTKVLSYEGPFGVGYLVASVVPGE